VLFPAQKRILETFGNDLLLAAKRRGLNNPMLCEHSEFDIKTVNNILVGDPGVAIGAYIKILGILGLEANFAELAAHDEVGRKLQDASLLASQKWLYMLISLGSSLGGARPKASVVDSDGLWIA
jgi:hypothetical protein